MILSILIGLSIGAFFLVVCLLALKSGIQSPQKRVNAVIDSPIVVAKVRTTWGELNTCKKITHQNQHTPVLFLHGLGSAWTTWKPLIEQWEGPSCYALDLPGFGNSSKNTDVSYGLDEQSERLLDYVRSLKLETVNIIGCSMGASLGFWLQKLAPDLINKVVAIAPAATPRLVFLPKAVQKGLLKINSQKIPLVIRRSTLRIALTNGVSDTASITDKVVDEYMDYYNQPGALQAFLQSLNLIRDTRIYEQLHLYNERRLILWGQGDKVIRRSVIDHISQKMPNSGLIVHPWGGHHLMEDDPAWVREQAQSFLVAAHI